MKSISFTVTNDLAQDQRMNRICSSLVEAGYHSTLIGRMRSRSKPLLGKSFMQKRIPCFFERGKMFYVEYNFRLLFVLLFSKYDAYCAVDLDTIIPNYLVSKIKGKPLVYDAHEYFTELEEVVTRPFTKGVWKLIEKWIIPQVIHSYTVSEGYKKLFDDEYNTDFGIIRNATVLKEFETKQKAVKYILYQGAVNQGRGLDKLILAMHDVDCKLIVCGDGDILPQLKELVAENNLQSKIEFKGFVEPVELVKYTRCATIGITLFANAGLSNQYSLANRFFDYMHAGVPQLAMNYPEYKNFNSKWKIAYLLDDLSTEAIKTGLNKLLTNNTYYELLASSCVTARTINCWQEEENKLVDIFDQVFR
jgi:glycosyltransferase involved in cell wall biosynthesis